MICDQASQDCDLCDQVSQDCDLLGENSRLLHFTRNVLGNISSRSEKSQEILPLGISRKSQGKVEKHQTYSEASKTGRNIQG